MAAAERLPSVADQVASIPFWYHRIDLGSGITTPGWAPLSLDSYRIPEDMTGMRVLDVGAWDGFWTFEALKRGAREVVAIDDFSDFLGTPEAVGRRSWDSFDICRSALGWGLDRCRREEMSVYEINEGRLGRFDVVFCFGVLSHLRHPLLALDFLSGVCDSGIFVATATCEDYSPYKGAPGNGNPGSPPVLEFYPTVELGNNPTNWWAPNLACLGLMVMAAGWSDVEVWKLTDGPEHAAHCRGFARGVKPAA
ncbi:MAG: class I SAM-dependent methyltransferase [Fimbriimonadaceae bacterium]|nr:class I SAM-dependent methyltransferase [Fimbriimonadaceae bacterium]